MVQHSFTLNVAEHGTFLFKVANDILTIVRYSRLQRSDPETVDNVNGNAGPFNQKLADEHVPAGSSSVQRRSKVVVTERQVGAATRQRFEITYRKTQFTGGFKSVPERSETVPKRPCSASEHSLTARSVLDTIDTC